jgi:hypothetical protein
MKKFLLLFFVAVSFFFLISLPVKAAFVCDDSSPTGFFNPTDSGKSGIVPCGKSDQNSYSYTITCKYFTTTRTTWLGSSSCPSPDETFKAEKKIMKYGSVNAETQNEAYNRAADIADTINCTPPGTSTVHGFDFPACIRTVVTQKEFDGKSITVRALGSYPKCRCELGHVFILGLNIYNFIVRDIATPLAALLFVLGGVLLVASGANPNWASTGKKIMWSAGIGIVIIFSSWVIINVVLSAIGYAPAWSSLPI